MRSSKQRSRSKSNRPKSLGNIVNRVFDSSGPEGKVRGTPQQIIEKYQVLARDAQLSNDRVAAENFQQHAEHYTRMLAQAQREMQAEADARRQQQEDRNRHQQQDDRNRQQRRSGDDRSDQNENGHQQHGHSAPAEANSGTYVAPRPESFSVQHQDDVDDSTLVETPEAKSNPAPARSDSSAIKPVDTSDTNTTDAPAPVADGDAPKKPVRRKRTPKPATQPTDASAEASVDDTPKPRRNTRKPRKPAAAKQGGDAQPDLPDMKPNAAE